MTVNDTAIDEKNYSNILEINDKVSGELILQSVYSSGNVVKNTTIGGAGVFQPFMLDSLGGAIKDIRTNFYLVADAAATFTVSILKTRPGDLVTFVQDAIKTYTITTPAVAGVYSYDFGDLAEGLQAEIQIAQNNAGNATNACDAELTYMATL